MTRPASRLRRLACHVVAVPVAGPRDELVPAAESIELTDEDMRRLRAKYDEERDRRLDARPEGRSQYSRVVDLAASSERFAKLLADPFPAIETPHPLTDEVHVCIIGAGYGGLCAGARLVMEGVDPKGIRIIDRGGDVGGTWYWNRYPGAACDVEAYVYMPLCEEVGYVPTMKYASGPELLAHSQLIARKYGLYENASFGAEVNGLDWDEASRCWVISTDRQDRFRAHYVVMNFGTLSQPQVPKVPGLAEFEGDFMHTSRWDYAYTGGTPEGGKLDGLAKKRVAVVGTGASGVQVIPHLGRDAKHLYVFQRTPSSIDIRNNRHTTPEFAREFLSQPGWQRERNGNFYDMVQTTRGADKDLVNDGWTDIIQNLQVKAQRIMRERMANAKPEDYPDIKKELKRAAALSQFQQMEKIRLRAQIVVDDAATAEGLKPWYDQFCKRPCFHDGYLDTFNRPNVTLVDTNGLGIEGFTRNGILSGGKEYKVDTVILATGFEVSWQFGRGQITKKVGFDIVGRDGVKLDAKWSDPSHRYGAGPKTYRSHFTQGFPNFFMLNAPQGTFTVNYVYNLDEAARHFAHIIAKMDSQGLRCFDLKADVEEAYLDKMWKMSPTSKGRRPACTPGYYNLEGELKPKGHKELMGMYPGSARKFFRELTEERDADQALDVFDLC